MTEREYTAKCPMIRVISEEGEIVWEGFGYVEEIVDVTEENTVKENKKEGVSNPHSNAVDVPDFSGNPTSKKSGNYRQRVKDPFLCISMNHWRTTKLTAKELQVFLFMADHSDRKGKVHASQATIASELEITQQGVSNYVISLIKKGFILKRVRKGYATCEFSISPRAAWSDKLIYRNSQLERLKKQEHEQFLANLKKEKAA